MPTRVFRRFCDAFLLLLLLFIGNMMKQLISEVTVCLFGFSSPQTMCKLKKKKKIIYVLYIIVGQKFSGKVACGGVFFFPGRKQFNFALGEGRWSVAGACTVSAIQSRR